MLLTMEAERFWLRHPSLAGHQGPYAGAELRRAIESGAFPKDSYLLRDRGQELTARQRSVEWRPAYEVLVMPAPPGLAPPPPSAAQDAQPAIDADARRQQVRRESAYAGVRLGVNVLTVMACVFCLLAMLAAIVGGAFGKPLSGVVALVGLGLEVVAILVVSGVVKALLDVADCAVRRYPHPRDDD